MTLIMVARGVGVWFRGNGHFFGNGRREDSARHFKRNCTRDRSELCPSPKDMLGLIYIARKVYTNKNSKCVEHFISPSQ